MMFERIGLILCVVLMATTVSAMHMQSNACPQVATVDVPWDDYKGDWYEIAVSPLARQTFEKDCMCTKANYFARDDELIGVYNTCYRQGRGLSKAIGTAKIRGPGQLGVSFSPIVPRAPYWVIQYQSGSYAVVWSCVDMLGVRGQNLWVLSRTPTMDPRLYQQIVTKAHQQTGFPIDSLTITTQRGCNH